MIAKRLFESGLQLGAALIGVLAIFSLSGCNGFGAIGNKQDFRTAQAPLTYRAQGTATVLAFDERPFVLSGSHHRDFVGLQLNNYGIPFSVKTKSGRPFANDVTDAFTRSLVSGGIAAIGITLSENEDADDDPPDTQLTLAQARELLLKDHPRRALLVRISQWESSTYKYTTLEFDLTATVYDSSGVALVSKRIQGRDELGGRILGAASKAREVSAAALPLKIDEILNSPEIRAVFVS